MTMTRFTAKDLESEVARMNDILFRANSPNRFECGGRNGYQAVDEYSVNPDGSRKGSGIDRNVGCGTSRECSRYAWQRLSEILAG
jgi:hypothetical protein